MRDLPNIPSEIKNIISVGSKLQRGDLEGALNEVAVLQELTLLPQNVAVELSNIRQAAASIINGNYSDSLKYLIQTGLGKELVKIAPQQIVSVQQSVTQLTEINSVATFVKNMKLSSALELVTSSKLLPVKQFTSQQIASLISMSQHFLNIQAEFEKESFVKVIPTAILLLEPEAVVTR